MWRVRNPKTNKFTRVERSRNGIVQSRLDYWLLSLGLSYQVDKIDIHPGLCSDHSLITLTLEIQETCKRGKGYWKFNDDLLTEIEYANNIRETIQNIKQTTNIENKTVLWEYIKCQIRTNTTEYSSKRAKQLKKQEIELNNQLKDLEPNIDNEQVYLEYIQIKAKWEHIIQKKINGIIVRSRAQWAEEGEKNTKLFISLEKRNHNNTYIKKLIKDDETELHDPNDIIEEQKKFYSTLYSTKNQRFKDSDYETYLRNTNTQILDENDKQLCEEPLTVEEIGKALQNLPNGKSPGADGLTTNFFKFFCTDIKDIVLDSFNEICQSKNMSQFQKRAILNLQPKGDKDIRYLKNWRPVSLLSTDYKILTKALAMRLQKVIYKIVNPDQVGYIKGRYIGENVRTIFDIINYADQNNQKAYIGQIDFEKAFDSIEWPFLFKTLEKFNFGDIFIQWIKILYNDIYTCVGNNGYYSNYFKLTRSIRQGCPISALLFILVAEILASKLREEKGVKGIVIEGKEYKLCMLADDMTLFLMDLESLKNAIGIFKTFETYSGLKLNLSKTELIPIGKCSEENIKLGQDLEQIKIGSFPFKALGIWYAKTQEEIKTLNYIERIQKIDKLINIWKLRNLSLKGKITIIKTLLLPQIQFLFSMLYTPNNIIKQIDEKLFNFLWDNKPAKIKRDTIIAPIKDGGLGMVDTYEVNTTAKCMWIKRLLCENQGNWKTLFRYMLNIQELELNKNLHKKNIDKCKTPFHMQVLESWLNVSTGEPTNLKNTLNQFIFYNQYITVNNKPIEPIFPNVHETEIKIIDILNNNGKFINLTEFNNKYNTNSSQLSYNSLLCSIPKNWKKDIKSIFPTNNLEQWKFNNEILTNIIKNPKPIENLTSKDIYIALIRKKIKPPTAIETWINIYPFLEDIDWEKIFQIPYYCSIEPYLQSFQYKILNRLLNCNEKLNKWKIKPTDKCTYCNEVDTIAHHLYYCHTSAKLWRDLKIWMTNNLEVAFEFTICEIIFGIPIEKDENIDLLNFLILITKHYINKTKTEEKSLYFIELLSKIRSKISIVCYINASKGVNNKEWQDTLCDNL